MSTVDYHVGLLRGYLIATNAHQTILHALEIVLTKQRSAGESIGGKVEISSTEQHIVEIRKAAEPEKVTRAFSKWTSEEIRSLMALHKAGKTINEMTKNLPGKKYSTIYAKHMGLSLEPNKKTKQSSNGLDHAQEDSTST